MKNDVKCRTIIRNDCKINKHFLFFANSRKFSHQRHFSFIENRLTKEFSVIFHNFKRAAQFGVLLGQSVVKIFYNFLKTIVYN